MMITYISHRKLLNSSYITCVFIHNDYFYFSITAYSSKRNIAHLSISLVVNSKHCRSCPCIDTITHRISLDLAKIKQYAGYSRTALVKNDMILVRALACLVKCLQIKESWWLMRDCTQSRGGPMVACGCH